MGRFDKLTGTKRPDDGVVPDPAEEVRAALLGLNRPDVPYVVRDGGAHNAKDADLVAEWRVAEPAWQTVFLQSQLTRTVRIRMRLVQEKHEVRAVEEQSQVTGSGIRRGSRCRRSTRAGRRGPSPATGRSNAGTTATAAPSKRRRLSASTARS